MTKKTKADSGTDPRRVPQELVDLLACPACDDRPPVKLNEAGDTLSCGTCKLLFPVRGGIPVMLVEEATTA